MLSKLLKIFKTNPDFFYITIGALLSTIGMSLTSIAVYGELASSKAEPVFYTLAFSLEIVPAVLTSYISRRFFHNINIATILFLVEFIGGVLILLPILGTTTNSLLLILFAVAVTSAVTGFLIPFHNTHMRRVLTDEEMTYASVLSTYSFAVVFIMGTLLGSVLYTTLGTANYFLLDSLTYLISCLFTYIAWKLRPDKFTKMSKDGSRIKLKFKNLSTNQKNAFLLNLIMAINCAPATALLPSLAKKFGITISFYDFMIMPVLVFLILKTTGQLLGPLFIQKFNFDKLVSNKILIPGCLLFFHLCYFLIFNTESLSVIMSFIVIAHTASNVVFILSYYVMRRHFNENEVGTATSIQHQLSILIMAGSSIIAGYIAQYWSYNVISIIGFFVWAVYMAMSMQLRNKVAKEAVIG